MDPNLYGYSLNNPINYIDPWGLWGVNVGGSSVGIDFTATIYDSEKGWFPNPETNIGASTTLVGGGFQITFDTPIKTDSNPKDDINVSFGLLSKYTGVTYDTNLNRGSINLGVGFGLPITLSTSLENFINSIGNKLLNNAQSEEEEPCK